MEPHFVQLSANCRSNWKKRGSQPPVPQTYLERASLLNWGRRRNLRSHKPDQQEKTNSFLGYQSSAEIILTFTSKEDAFLARAHCRAPTARRKKLSPHFREKIAAALSWPHIIMQMSLY